MPALPRRRRGGRRPDRDATSDENLSTRNAWPRAGGYRRRLEERAGRITMKHIIAVLLENEPGALSRVVALFSARGYNIESLTVAPTEDASLSRMTIVTTGSRRGHRADHQAPEPADRGGQGGRPDRRQLHRARADADQGARGRQGARRDEAHGRHLPRPHHRRHREELHASSSPATAPSSTPSWWPSTAPRSWKPCAPAPAASAAASESCGCEAGSCGALQGNF